MDSTRGRSKHLLALLSFGWCLAFAGSALAQPDIRIAGPAGYSHTANRATLTVDRIDNLGIDQGISVNVRLELWAFPTPYSSIYQLGYEQQGYLLATYELGPLAFGYYFLDVNSGSVPFAPPPAGKWYMTLMVTEYNGGNHNAYGFLPRDFVNFAPEVFPKAAVTVQSVPATVPQTGLWWNPDESGTGYALDYKNGKLVVTVYSYKPNGEPQWYLAAGPLDGPTFTASLDRYAAGACLGCAYTGRPALAGSDGTITIHFASPTSATVTLPGGRVTRIVPQEF